MDTHQKYMCKPISAVTLDEKCEIKTSKNNSSKRKCHLILPYSWKIYIIIYLSQTTSSNSVEALKYEFQLCRLLYVIVVVIGISTAPHIVLYLQQ